MRLFYQRSEKLKTLWNDNKGKMGTSALNEVLDSGFVHSGLINPEKDNVLVAGINPSYRKVDFNSNEDHSGYTLNSVSHTDIYYNRIKEALHVIPDNWTIEYTDLFYLRQTLQTGLGQFFTDDVGKEFMFKQLAISQWFIEALQPRLIVIFNKGSWDFWGKNYNSRKETKVWMGYDFKWDEKLKVHRISGVKKGHPGIISPDMTESELIGTPVYFSKYLRYMPLHKREKIREEIRWILQNL